MGSDQGIRSDTGFAVLRACLFCIKLMTITEHLNI